MTVVDPLETAAEFVDWQVFVQEIEATIPFPDSTTADPAIVWADAASGVPKPYGGPISPSGWPELDFVAPWEGMLGTTAVDEATGLTVPLDLKGAPVSPAFYDSETKTWSVNPAYTAWAVSVGEGVSKPSLSSVPAPDAPIFYHGAGPFATWNDVYVWAAEQNAIENAAYLDGGPATNAGVARAVNVATGTTIKALGGFISQNAQATAWLARASQARLDALQLAQYVVAANLNSRLVRAEKIQGLILKLAIPSLQAQIKLERHNRIVYVDRHLAAEVDRVRNDVYVPLNHDIQANQIEANTKIQQVHDGVPDQVRALAPELIAPAIAATTALATRVAALEAESLACVKPMCATMGPLTDLGKFLKALKVAEWLALLAEIAALRADGLDGVLSDVESWAATAIHTFESLFFEGGKTLGETVLGIG